MTTSRSRRLAAPGLLALGLLSLAGCGRHHRQELQAGDEPPLAESDGNPKHPPIVNRDSPAVLRWAGGD